MIYRGYNMNIVLIDILLNNNQKHLIFCRFVRNKHSTDKQKLSILLQRRLSGIIKLYI